jgi:hypothetical protein
VAEAGLCKSCGKPIWWATTLKGNPIPLCRSGGETVPAEFTGESLRGRVQRVLPDRTLFAPEWDLTGPVIVRILKETEKPNGELPIWRAHFWDCPHSKQWRKAKTNG